MRLRDAAKWIKEKITGKKTEETPVLTPMIATEEDIEKAKEMDREICLLYTSPSPRDCS